MTPSHCGTSDGACTCDAEGFLAVLSCGCESWSHGDPPVGGYITCGGTGPGSGAHQSSYKVISVRPGRPGAATGR
jgi:hypothetical protein